LKTTALILAGRRSSSVVLAGIDPAQEQQVTFIHRKLTAGQYRLGDRTILLGQALADSLGLRLGDPVEILTQDSFGQPPRARLTVGGLFASGLRQFDQAHAYLDLADARAILDAEEDALTEIALALPPAQVEAVALALRRDLDPAAVQIGTYRDLAPDLVQLMDLNDATFRLLILILFAIVALGIANTMTTVIFERFRELGTLAAQGATPLQIVLLICTESTLLGLVAAALGSSAALIACQWLAVHGIDLTRFTSSNQYFAAGALLKAHLAPADLVAANAITLGTALLAGLFPAIKAARLKPVEALRFT
jgi:ABC-type lipoprotein release transport system permease subunit